MRATFVGVLTGTAIILTEAAGGPSIGSGAIRGGAVNSGAFNPSRAESVTFTYALDRADRVSVRVWDPDGGLVRKVADMAPRAVGTHHERWDGKDDGGRVVPDEAYVWTVETASGATYDPMALSGGVVADIKDARFDGQAGTVTYRLPAASRVLIRLGVQSGPMLKTLVDWKPRVAGSITEYWDGRDESGLIRLRDNPNFTALITYVTLPDATVITYGNAGESYRDYKLGRGKAATRKPERPRLPDPQGRLVPVNLVPPVWSRAPRVQVTFRGAAGDVPSVKDYVDVHVDVDPTDRDRLLQDQFELIFFVDNVFFAEAERGHLPFNWRWEVHQLPPGEHVLTVNVASFRGQVGVASRKVQVTRP